MCRCLLMMVLWFLLAGAQLARADFITQVQAGKPKGFWVLNDASTTAVDSSGNAIPFNGKYESGVTPQGTNGPPWPFPEKVANFTGGNISFPSPLDPWVDGVKGFTIQAWINPSSLSGTTRIVASGNGVEDLGQKGYAFGTSGSILLFTGFGSPDYVTATGILKPTEWQYVGVVLQANANADFYLNGSFVETVTGLGIIPGTTATFTIGNQSPGGANEPFIGGLAGVSVFDRALTSTEIQDQYTASLPEPSSLVLTGLAAFGAGYTWWRRRRKAISAVPL